MLAIRWGWRLFAKRCSFISPADYSLHQRQQGQLVREGMGFRFRYGLDRPAQPIWLGWIDQETQDKGLDGSHLSGLNHKGLTED